MEGIFYLPPGGVQQYIDPDSRIPGQGVRYQGEPYIRVRLGLQSR